MNKESINTKDMLFKLILSFCFFAVFCLLGCGGSNSSNGDSNLSYIPAPLTEQNLVNGANAVLGAAQVSGLSRSICNDSIILQRKVARALLKNESVEVDSKQILMRTFYNYDKPQIYGSFVDDPQVLETDNSFTMKGDLWADYTPDDGIAGGKMKLDISIAASLFNDHSVNISFTIKVDYYNFYYNGQHWLYEEGSKVNGSLVMNFNDNLAIDEIEGALDDYLETCVFSLKGSISYTLEDETQIFISKNETIGYDDLYNEILRINGQDKVISNGLGISYDLEDIIIGIYDDMPNSGKMIARNGDKTKTITFINDSFQIDGQDVELDFTPHGTFFEESSINVSGTWRGTWQSSFYGLSGTFTATIIQQDLTLSGSIEVPEIDLYDAELKGTAKGETIVFGDIEGQITFTGTVVADSTSSGTYIYTSLNDNGNWQGSKEMVTFTVNWQKSDMGSAYEKQRHLVVGDGRNDGIMRVYSGDDSGCGGNIYEFSFVSNQWQKENFSVIETQYGTDNLCTITGIDIGTGCNDGVNKIYASGYNMAEFSYDSNTWHFGTMIGGDTQWTNDIAVGDARNDGIVRVYVAMWDSILELTHNKGNWDIHEINTDGNGIENLVITDGQNDGTLRLYASQMTGDHIYEYSWLGSTWQVNDCGASGAISFYDMVAGDGRNDGKNRIYVAANYGGIYELSYDGDSWQYTVIANPAPMGYVGTVAVGDGRDDGVNHVYAWYSPSISEGYLAEYTFSGSWSQENIDSGLKINDIAIGNGKNNGINCVYVTADDSHIYEYSVE